MSMKRLVKRLLNFKGVVIDSVEIREGVPQGYFEGQSRMARRRIFPQRIASQGLHDQHGLLRQGRRQKGAEGIQEEMADRGVLPLRQAGIRVGTLRGQVAEGDQQLLPDRAGMLLLHRQDHRRKGPPLRGLHVLLGGVRRRSGGDRGFREIRQIRAPSIQGEARHPVDFGAYKRQTRNQ